MALKKWIGALAALGFLVWLFQARNSYRHLLAVGEKTVAVVLEAAGKNMTVVYRVRGTTYEKVLSEPFDGFYKGETFVILYDPQDPAHAEVRFHEPVYDQQAYASTPATAYGTASFGSFIQFEYRVGQKTHTRFQDVHPDKAPIKGKPGKVFYNLKNPEIAYLEY
ncbi:hypothetical protein BEN47_15540 [Hymenobacter lapidarius]|uniref:DUF3592 domain-containing protein n=1 Tax=Hymenobacter lapidarius TaxID=1908237 RepID=A0A1G1T287_9BACT|nr:hypothetical protein [Hymenobacter lapidarius]OGX84970.1 hypothetical protein BEN47_15540 [Hymenobacter lapidarius]